MALKIYGAGCYLQFIQFVPKRDFFAQNCSWLAGGFRAPGGAVGAGVVFSF